ncbi:KAP family P-loop NTPase fold protein [Ewingella americana]
MNWDWSEKVEYLNETLPPDNLDRAKYAKFLYEVAAKRGETSNLVININAEWGAGKTHFTRRLAQTIKENHPTVYVDAWKQDFSDDPLLAIFSSISDQLGDQSDKFTALAKITEKKVGVLLKGVAPAIIQGLVKKFTGIDDFSEIAKSLTESVIDLHKEKSAVIEEIKKDLSEWVRFIKQKDGIQKDLPIFIFIDELDRCRPSYAIALLEIVKHIFDVKGLVFFISTDTDQLQHSIKVIYGQDFNAQQYLGRFFDRRHILNTPKIHDLLYTKLPNIFKENYLLKTEKLVPQPISPTSFIETCSNILDAFEINIRDSIKYFDRLCDIILVEKKNFDPFLLLMIMYFHDRENDLYINLKNQSKNSKISAITEENVLLNKTKNGISKEINLCLDLSESKTQVTSLYCNGPHLIGLINNEYHNETIKTSVREYFKRSTYIINTPMHPNTSSSGYDYYAGGISNTKDIFNFLSICWISKKRSNNELQVQEYFDLVELSTTLE